MEYIDILGCKILFNVKDSLLSQCIMFSHLILKIKKSQSILFQWHLGHVYSVHFQALAMKTFCYKYYIKEMSTCDNSNVQSKDQEEGKSNSTINFNNLAQTFTHDKIIKIQFNKNNVATSKSK